MFMATALGTTQYLWNGLQDQEHQDRAIEFNEDDTLIEHRSPMVPVTLSW